MSLYLYFSASLKNLANKLADDMGSSPERDPFRPQTVIVPNQSVKQWLQLQIAKENGIAADIDFLFFEAGLWTMIQRLDACAHSVNGCNPKRLDEKQLKLLVMFWLRNATESGKHDAAIFNSYIRDENDVNHRKIWQLSTRLAMLLGHYEYHRPHWLNDWRENHKPGAADLSESVAELEHAERTLFYDMFGPHGVRAQINTKTETAYCLLSEYADRILNSRSESESIRQKTPIHIFGMTRLTPRDINYLFALGQHFEIRLYQFSVCCEFWEDIPTRSQQRRLRALEFKRIRTLRQAADAHDRRPNLSMDLLENPLLQAWGHAGRETMVLFSEYEERYQRRVDCTGEWLEEVDTDNSQSVLHQLQCNIRHRLKGDRCLAPDKSLQIIACPSIYREVEMVYDSIIHNMETDRDLKLTDVAIMVANINEYKPALDYVFSGDGQIPYNLIDGNAAVESIYGQALVSMLNLAQGNFTRKDVFDLMFNPCFLAGAGVSRAEATQWLEWADKLGIFREFDAGNGSVSRPFSWQHGLTRLRLGRIMTTDGDDETDDIPVFQNLAPYDDMECSDQDVISRFSMITEALYNHLMPLKSAEHSLHRWRQCIQDICDRFLGIPSDRPGELAVRSRLFEFFEDAEVFDALDTAANTIPLQLLIEMIKSELLNIPSRKGTFLSRGVTILSLRPMRPIPFKMVYMLGMKEGDFPGTNDDSMLDLRQSFHPQPGDVNLSDANRYTFLETLMAVEEKLYSSYVASDLKKEEDFYPCSVLKQLIHSSNTHIVTSAQPVVEFPLKGNSIHYLDATLADKTYTDVFEHVSRSNTVQALADVVDRLNSSEKTPMHLPKNFGAAAYKINALEQIKRALPSFDPHPQDNDDRPRTLSIPLRELARFLENPVEAGARFHLQLFDEAEDTRELGEDEPFFSIFPTDWKFEIEVLETFIRQYAKHKIAPDAHALHLNTLHHFWQQRSRMPAGHFGDHDRHQFADRIQERIAGSSKVNRSIIDLLNEHSDQQLQLISNAAIGNAGADHKRDLHYSPLVLDIPTGDCENSQSVELSGLLPFAWQSITDGHLNACLKITTKSAIKDNSPNKHCIEPFLFFVAISAAGMLPEGTEFTIYLSHKKGIYAKSYTAWSAEQSRCWLTELVSSYLGQDAFDLLPYSIVTNLRGDEMKPWVNPNPITDELGSKYKEHLANAIETVNSADYNPPDVLRLVNPVVPDDAFTKVRDRLGPILR